VRAHRRAFRERDLPEIALWIPEREASAPVGALDPLELLEAVDTAKRPCAASSSSQLPTLSPSVNPRKPSARSPWLLT
jgi:hypothetical protein